MPPSLLVNTPTQPTYKHTRVPVCVITRAQDVEFTAEFDQLANWIADVKKIFQVELFENGKTKCVVGLVS
jgi:hypothetical protein